MPATISCDRSNASSRISFWRDLPSPASHYILLLLLRLPLTRVFIPVAQRGARCLKNHHTFSHDTKLLPNIRGGVVKVTIPLGHLSFPSSLSSSCRRLPRFKLLPGFASGTRRFNPDADAQPHTTITTKLNMSTGNTRNLPATSSMNAYSWFQDVVHNCSRAVFCSPLPSSTANGPLYKFYTVLRCRWLSKFHTGDIRDGYPDFFLRPCQPRDLPRCARDTKETF
ncbi:hypothetical protein GE09DRAFT_530983 [Coniochaeta sp. 2T2.1]|nr:hypothetical protein GE09DRAFT_530983 [Coniochaeta sp. 2T2.1]